MPDVPLIVEEPPRGAAGKASAWLRGRRVFLACCLAAAEVVAFIIWRPSALLLTLFAVILLAACIFGIIKVAPGLPRDILWIVGIAQAMIVVVPLVVGFSLVLGLIVALVLIVAIGAAAFRMKF